MLDFSSGSPIKIVGVMNALVARLAQEAGFKALYLSGASLSSAQFAMPDLGILTLNDIVEEAKKIVLSVNVPLIVDIDNGWNHPLLLERAGIELQALGVYAVQIEDQSGIKRCGHLPVKELVSKEEMCRKIEILKGCQMRVLCRTDALGLEGIDATIERLIAYQKAGADFIFLEAVRNLSEILIVKPALNRPLLINMTEFGKTPLWTEEDLKRAGVDLILYPMTVNRVMYQAARQALQTIKNQPSQESLLPHMMTRDELYEVIHYQKKEEML
jgi:methylisocitrate lyase